jgi:pyrroline-5-carboxylate reductase
MLTGKKIGFIGGGAMAEALIRGISGVGLVDITSLYVADASEKRRAFLRQALEIQTFSANVQLLQNADIIFLTVKPQIVETVLQEVGATLRIDQLVVSIAAGVTIETLEKNLPTGTPVVRVMPNTPVLVREGAAAVAVGQYATKEHAEIVETIFNAVGRVAIIQEDLMDAVTGLSGSGPAYACMIVEALADGGVRMGLPRSTALLLAAQTLLGTAKMLLETEQHPGILRDMVASPGGTTIAGIHALEEGGLRAALINAVVAGAERSRELGKVKK